MEFFVFPRKLIDNKKFNKMNGDSKILYMLMLDKFFDKNQVISIDNGKYILFTNVEIMEKLNCANEKATRIKKELIDNGLIDINMKSFRKYIKVNVL